MKKKIDGKKKIRPHEGGEKWPGGLRMSGRNGFFKVREIQGRSTKKKKKKKRFTRLGPVELTQRNSKKGKKRADRRP